MVELARANPLIGTGTRKVRWGRLVSRTVIYAALTAGGLAMIFPFLWMLSTSFQSAGALLVPPPQLIPSPIELGNYAEIASAFPLWRFLANSLGVAAVATTLQVATSAMAGYAFARLRFRGRDALFLLYIATLMVPLQVTILPLFVEMKYLGLVDSYGALVLPSIASAFGTFLLRQAFLGLPRELEEAAFMDGAGHLTVFRRIVLPLAMPAIATLAVFSFVASWNSFLWPLIIVNSPDLMTLPVGLSNLQGRYATAWNLLMAGSTVAVVPILIVYVIGQKYVIRGVTLSGLKG
ncbi:MAG TPA: carbohydrate ABC transporter permease [Candidatus Limnocylindrales bacterium]|nr:carbohydrate ABC transporter permease [Candidatus Limnocylindrales bacterium]